jgi:hypothetical protein
MLIPQTKLIGCMLMLLIAERCRKFATSQKKSNADAGNSFWHCIGFFGLTLILFERAVLF